jgi:hypothetical protein
MVSPELFKPSKRSEGGRKAAETRRRNREAVAKPHPQEGKLSLAQAQQISDAFRDEWIARENFGAAQDRLTIAIKHREEVVANLTVKP